MKVANFREHLAKIQNVSDLEGSKVTVVDGDAMDRAKAMVTSSSKAIRVVVSTTAPATPFASTRITGSVIVEDDVQDMNEIPSLDKIRLWALEYGYSLNKIEYESTDLSGTNKIKLKGE